MIDSWAMLGVCGLVGMLGTAGICLGIQLPDVPAPVVVVAVLPLNGEDARDGNDGLRSILLAAVEFPKDSGSRLFSFNINAFEKGKDLGARFAEMTGDAPRKPAVIAHVTTDQLIDLQLELSGLTDAILTSSASATRFSRAHGGGLRTSPVPTLTPVEQFCPDNHVLAASMYAILKDSEATAGSDCPHVIAKDGSESKFVEDLTKEFFAERTADKGQPAGTRVALTASLAELNKCAGAVFIGDTEEFKQFLQGTARSLGEPGSRHKFTLVVADAASSKNIFNNSVMDEHFTKLKNSGWEVLFTTLYAQETRESADYSGFSRRYHDRFAERPSPSSYWVYQTALTAFGGRGQRHAASVGVAVLSLTAAAAEASSGVIQNEWSVRDAVVEASLEGTETGTGSDDTTGTGDEPESEP